jgi:hypothetical protein
MWPVVEKCSPCQPEASKTPGSISTHQQAWKMKTQMAFVFLTGVRREPGGTLSVPVHEHIRPAEASEGLGPRTQVTEAQ